MQAAIISLDQEKAFDRVVAHDYLFKTITAHNLGIYIETWIKTLYKNPQSQLLVNHTLSEPFSLTRSIRQGCSLSHLLYILTLEPLLENTRQNTTGVSLPGRAKLLAYALFVWLVGFLTSSSTTRLYRGRAPRQERLTILRAATHEAELGDHDFYLILILTPNQ